jgi:hypothetical protein
LQSQLSTKNFATRYHHMATTNFAFYQILCFY